MRENQSMRDTHSLAIKSSSLESLASSVPLISEDSKTIKRDIFHAIDTGDADKLNSMLNEDNIQTLVLQILLMTTIPNDDDKYVLEPDPSMNHLLGNSYALT